LTKYIHSEYSIGKFKHHKISDLGSQATISSYRMALGTSLHYICFKKIEFNNLNRNIYLPQEIQDNSMILDHDIIKKKLGKVKVVYTDVDGTFVHDGCLYKTATGYTLKNAQAIYHLLEANVDIVMTSGRERDKLKDTARLLGFKNYIANLGLEIVYNQGKKVINNFGVDLPDHSKLKEWIENSGAVQTIFDKYAGKVDFYKPWSDMLRTHFLLVGELDDDELDELFSSTFPALRIIDNGAVPPYRHFLHPHAYHVVPRAAGKRSAVQLDKKERNLKTENLVGIGDSQEDTSIADQVAVFFLLDDSIQVESDNIIRINNRGGEAFSEIVQHLMENNFI
jgi:HAD superfamily hydrolase (TIGR01484 family)